MQIDEPSIGIHKEQLDTPVLLIDLDVMESNIAKMAEYFRGVDAELRPHTKTHKTPILAHKQIEAGAIGVTCAKLGEAEVMVAGGIKDVLIANEIVTYQKIARLVNLAKHADVMVAVDDPHNVENLSQAAREKGVHLRVLVEVDIGMKRCGVPPGEPALRLAQKAEKAKGLLFAGLMGYEGHTVTIPDFEERKRRTEESLTRLIETKDLIERNGLEVGIVSGGGTGTYNITGQFPGMTEVQAGSYILMDASYRRVLKDFDCALTVLTTVMSRPTEDRAIADAGMKTVTKDSGLPEVKDVSGLEVFHLSEEHGKLDLSNYDADLKPGDRLELIPSHGCTTINLHDRFYGIRDGRLEAIWDIAGRGKVR
jgi:D-serine deaminase-like pyridoxal phosphate-dependent protein